MPRLSDIMMATATRTRHTGDVEKKYYSTTLQSTVRGIHRDHLKRKSTLGRAVKKITAKNLPAHYNSVQLSSSPANERRTECKTK
jgi:hypothetical protein